VEVVEELLVEAVVEDPVEAPEEAVEVAVVPEALEEVPRLSLNLTDMLVSLLLVERKISWLQRILFPANPFTVKNVSPSMDLKAQRLSIVYGTPSDPS
jgi:hypothetical protein